MGRMNALSEQPWTLLYGVLGERDKSPQAFMSEAWWEAKMNTVHFPSLFPS